MGIIALYIVMSVVSELAGHFFPKFATIMNVLNWNNAAYWIEGTGHPTAAVLFKLASWFLFAMACLPVVVIMMLILK